MESSNTLNRQFRSTFQLLSVSFRSLTFSKIITAGEKQNFVTSAPFTRDNKKKKKMEGRGDYVLLVPDSSAPGG